MIGAVSVGLVSMAFFHLLTHALFKALLFMCAGVIIHTMRDSQDIRFIGNTKEGKNTALYILIFMLVSMRLGDEKY
jgi:NADH-ubiquinone oxidoreductase chain 5